MKKARFPSLLEGAILLYCLWGSRNLLTSWYNTPHLKYADWAFFVWILPVLLYWTYPLNLSAEKKTTFFFFPIGLIIALLGNLGNLRALGHLGLALTVTGLLPWNPFNLIWAAASASWMPATGYFLRFLSVNTVIVLRLLTAALGMGIALFLIFKKRKIC